MRPLCLALLLALPLTACGEKSQTTEAGSEAHATAEYERGPHNGRMLRDGNFAIEITVFEDGVPPEYRLYAYRDDKPVAPGEVQANITIARLDGETTTFSFRPEQDYLRGNTTLVEPHSFDVVATANEGGRKHQWKFSSYEGRTTLAPGAAQAGGIETAIAGPAEVSETVEIIGRVEIDPAGSANVGAKFPGPVVAVYKNIGDRVARGTLLARVESSYSLQTYSVYAPISGVISQRNTNVGDVAGNGPMFVISDPSRTVATFPIFPRDVEKIRAGQAVEIKALEGDRSQSTVIRDFLPLVDVQTQTVTARAALPNPGDVWRPGMAIRGIVTIERRQVPLAVKSEAIQQFRDFRVVFAKIGNTYEVRMLDLGKEGPEWTEVLSGIKPGTIYASKNSYVIKADIEKSGASHSH